MFSTLLNGSIPTSSTIPNPLFSFIHKAACEIVPFLYRHLTEYGFSPTFLPVVMGLFVYTRHTADCPNLADRFWRRCRCPKWIRGLLRGNPVRVSAKTRSWERAESKLREMDGAGGPDETKLASKITIKEAVEAFLKPDLCTRFELMEKC